MEDLKKAKKELLKLQKILSKTNNIWDNITNRLDITKLEISEDESSTIKTKQTKAGGKKWSIAPQETILSSLI